MLQPDDNGPITTGTLETVASFVKALTEFFGSPPSSSITTSSLRPSTPPAALISSTARRIPSRTGTPYAANGPVVGLITPTTSGWPTV